MQMASTSSAAAVNTPTAQMNKFKSYVNMLVDSGCKDDIRLKATQEISENLEVIISSTMYRGFLDYSVKIFLKILQEEEPQFIAEYNIQQVRKLILEILHRLPTNDLLKPYVKPILSLTLKLLEIDNEENVLVCLKIIIELHKQYRPTFNPEIKEFLQFVKSIYSDLESHMDKIFKPHAPIKVKDLSELNLEELLKETFTITTIKSEKIVNGQQTVVCNNLIPKAVRSLKVIQELPIIVVLMYQLHKQNVHQDVRDFIPHIMNTIVYQPSVQHRRSETFNKEIFVDFMGAQIKTLSFLAYIIKIYQQDVSNHSKMLVQGMISLLTLCPMEVAHLRRELLIASRHILATELRNEFVPHMDKLFDEEVLLGRGWTTHESLRPLAYSTLADLVHHVRQHLQLSDIARAVHLFSKNVHDDTLATTIQTMSCKLLLNLVECLRKKDIEDSAECQRLLMRVLEVFVLKFKTIAKIQLPKMVEKCKQQQAVQTTPNTANNTTSSSSSLAPWLEALLTNGQEIKTEPEVKSTDTLENVLLAQKEEKSKFGFPPPTNYNVAEYRSLVKTLVYGVKSISLGCAACKPAGSQPTVGDKQLQPHETLVFIRLVKWALKALDIYMLPVGPTLTGPARANQQNIRNKEEKDVLEHFSGVFSMMHPQTFYEIFSTTIEYVVERIYKNSTLQIVANTLLTNSTMSPIFATVLVEYLLERMEEMGSNQERSNLYLKLFKLVFGSVSLYPEENEKMLQAHLHQIVNRSMELAMSAKEPYNYFLLLRALFRSIGGGSHNLLYQEFLPLLPNLLEELNRLQSGLHKQHMKDLFVELCLTVPVRLSSLLPYLPMLMDPLVSALNGSHVLISQGLRTLELCVDNLQHDFLYEHIRPFRADLMQALWRTLRNNDQVAQVAFKVLGKFGGGNRKMMIEPQKLEYIDTDYDPPAIIAHFSDHNASIDFPVERVIETAFNALKQSTTNSFYRKQAWEVINCYLVASLNLTDDKNTLLKLFMHHSFQDKANIVHTKGSSYKSVYKQTRKTHQTALIGMFVAAAIKELRDLVLVTLVNIVRYYTMLAVVQQAGLFAITPKPNEQVTMDPLVLIDALAVIMGHEEKELVKPGQIALAIIIDTATNLLGSRDLACKLPLIEYISEKMCALCYERAWYAKLGGCHAIEFMFERCAIKWVYEHMFTFLKALLFVMMDLTGEVSSGALDMAKNNLEKMLIVLVVRPDNADAETLEIQQKALHKVTHELVRQVTNPHTMVREQSMDSLRLLAEKQNKSVTTIMEVFRDVLADMVPPKKHLLKHQPAINQMGMMDGNMFCITLNPRLFTIDMNIREHNLFIKDLMSLFNTEDKKLQNLSCYKNITNFTPLRKSALRVLAACHYLVKETREDIFSVLYKTLEKPNPELQETAFECMKSFISGYQVEKDVVYKSVRPLLKTLGDVKNLTLNSVKMLSYLTQLFPNVFNEKLCDQLLDILTKLFENLTKQTGTTNRFTKRNDEEQKIVTVISFYHQTLSAGSKFIKPLCQLILQTEQTLLIEASSPYRDVLMMFLRRYPIETLEMFLSNDYINDPQYSRFLEYLIKHKDGKLFRDHIQNNMVHRLKELVLSNVNLDPFMTEPRRNEMQYQGIRIVYLLIRKDDEWIATQQELIESLKLIWCNNDYQIRHKTVDTLEFTHWREPKMLVKILLRFFQHHPNNIDLLFELLRALCDRFIPEFQFLKDFLENTMAKNFVVEWKRSAFFHFVNQFSSPNMSQELKAKVLQLIIIPCFAVSFENGETDILIVGQPTQYQANPENIVSVFINKLIDSDNIYANVDCVRISLLQFSCLLVEQASPHIHNNNKADGFKLRRLMTFAWPCLIGKNCVDAATRYHGHLLLSHIIDKFSIHRKIVLQVFHSLLKAHGLEARNVVRQALEILTPSIPTRLEKGHDLLTHWTKKMIVDEGHSMQQLFHILQLVVKHFKVYYPVRHNLVQYMVSSIQRLGFNPTATFEHRKLAVELSEVVIRWELYGVKGENQPEVIDDSKPGPSSSNLNKSDSTVSSNKPIDRAHTDMVLNFLLRLACQVNDPNQQNPVNPTGSSPGEILSRRCVALLKTALKPNSLMQPVDLKLVFFDKILQNVSQPNPNIASICTALELLTFLLVVMTKEQVLQNFKPLQGGIGACIMSSNNKVIRLVHTLLHKLMGLFPTERTNTSMTCKYVELEILYSTVWKVISEGLSNYEKNPKATPSSLYGTIIILKAACMNNNSYIDLIITPFMRVLHRIAKEHLQPATTPENNLITSELLILSLDLVKTRVVVMGVEMRKTFIGSILVGLIEKTQDIKVMKAIVKMLEDLMKNKNVVTLSQAPSLREKSILLVKLMQYVEKRFPEDAELNGNFLELINYVYTDEQLKQTELSAKLEPAFLYGLRCNQPHIRQKFFKIFDESMRRRLHDRLLYITSTQNWDAIGAHYWIKQCIELLIITANSDTPIQMSHESGILPNITSIINGADAKKLAEFTAVKQEPVFMEIKEEIVEMEIDPTPNNEEKPINRIETIQKLVEKHCEFIKMSKSTTSHRFLVAAAQLCHMDTSLAEQVWLQIFPKFWSILDDQQRNTLSQEIIPFIASGTHTIQKDCHPSAVNTFVEALTRCNPSVQLSPPLMKFIGKWHNLWHRMVLGLEQMALDPNVLVKPPNAAACYDFEPEVKPKHEVYDALGELYHLLCEEDMWAGLWQKHAHYRETGIAIAYEQHGFFEQAQTGYENAMAKYKQDFTMGPTSTNTQREVLLWTNNWIRCAKELRQWDLLQEHSKNGVLDDPFLMLDCSWRMSTWELTKEALKNVEFNCSPELQWKVTLYGGYLLLCHPNEKPLDFAEGYVETATNMCLQEWRRLPHIVSHIHLPFLQAAQQIMELQEAYQIRKGLQQRPLNSHYDMKATVKTWLNRLPVIADDLSHWNDIFTWRQHHYEYIVKHYEKAQLEQPNEHPGNSLLGVRASAQTIIHFGKIARKHKLTNVCLDSLKRIYSISSVSVGDCYDKINQQVKCYLQQVSISSKNDHHEGLEVINSANVSYFTKEMTAEFYALKGMLYQLSGKSDEANKAFSAAVQMHDGSIKAWAFYGDYLEQVFTKEPKQISLGVNAIICFLHACRHQNESKARKYLAKVLWLLSYDDGNSLMEALDKYSVGVPPLLWLPWTPQLLNCLVLYEGNVILNLLLQVGKMFPQAVYFPIRTLYFTLRRATARNTNTVHQTQTDGGGDQSHSSSQETSSGGGDPVVEALIKASPPMYRCSKIIKMQRDIHTTVLTSLEGIAEQIEWFREFWYEEVLRQLRQGLSKCYAIAFENRESINEVKITPHILNFVKKLVSTFGIGVENLNSSSHAVFQSAASESLAKRAEATYQDPVFKEMKQEFTKDFDFSQANTLRLRTLIFKLKKWIKILENRSKILVQSFLIEEKCRFLSNFTLKTAEVELPGEFLLPKHTHYYVRIARFMPRVDIVQKHNTAARRLYIRGHNGKIYPYLVVNDSGLADARREERVLQVLRMFNHYLDKQKETSKRFLHFTVPRVVAVSQQIRLVEDNVASISLLDIFKKGCAKLNIEHDAPIHYYYERLANVQVRGIKASHQVYRDILMGVQNKMVPKTMLQQWALATFPSATDYWQFRKMFTLQLSLACFAEYVLHLTRLNPDMIYLHQDSGMVNISYFKFDVDDSGELDIKRPVPFRLTPNITEYISPMGISGPLTASMIAVARCFAYPNFKVSSILKPILRDEMVLTRIKKPEEGDGLKKEEKVIESEREQLVNMVNKGVTAIMSKLNSLAHFDGVDSKVSTLVAAANNHDNLCRMDPAWHPWL